jgi:hypothetical protein
MNQLISGAYGLEVLIAPGQTKIELPYISTLKGKKFKHIDVVDSIPFGKSGKAVAGFMGNAEIDGYITLREENTQKMIFNNLNLDELKVLKHKGNRIAIGTKISIERSFITLTTNTIEETKVIYIVFYYDEPTVLKPKRNILTEISDFELTLKQSRTSLLEEPKLKNRLIRNLLVDIVGNTPRGTEKIGSDTLMRSFITLQKRNFQFFKDIPLQLFYQVGLYESFNFENISFDFTNSFIDVVNFVDDDKKAIFFNCILEA